MSKTTFKNLLWMALPLAFTFGCAHNRPQTEAIYSPLPATLLTPTSNRPEERIYSETPVEGIITPATLPPSVAVSEWRLGEEIRGALMADRDIAPSPSNVAAEICKGSSGQVILRGQVLNTSDRQRLHESIANLPGVNQVDDQVTVGSPGGSGTIHFENGAAQP
jgi:hypothetical protein